MPERGVPVRLTTRSWGRVSRTALAIGITLHPIAAGAQPRRPNSTTAPEPPTAGEEEALRRSGRHETWYGWQTLSADAGAVGLLLLAASFRGTASTALAIGAAGVYALGAPAVHLARGHWAESLLSLGLRVALPLAGVGIDAAIAGDADGRTWLPGLVAGCSGAIAADASLLGWEVVESRQALAPGIHVGRTGAAVTIAAPF